MANTYSTPVPLQFVNPISTFTDPQLNVLPFLKNYYTTKVPSTDYGDYFTGLGNTESSTTAPATQLPTTSGQFENPVPDTAADANNYRWRRSMDYGFDRAMLQDYLGMTNQQNMNQMLMSAPMLDWAAQRSTNRNLDASERWRSFVESQPTTRQQIAASQQGQMEAAANAEAMLQRATAEQMNAASNSWRGVSRMA